MLQIYVFYVKQSSFLTIFFAKAVEIYSVKTRKKWCFFYIVSVTI